MAGTPECLAHWLWKESYNFFPIRIYSYIFIHTNIFMNSVMCVCVHVREHVIIVIGSSVNV